MTCDVKHAQICTIHYDIRSRKGEVREDKRENGRRGGEGVTGSARRERERE